MFRSSRNLRGAIAGAALLAIVLSVPLAACGGSSSDSRGDSSSAGNEQTATDDTSPAQATATCAKANEALGSIGTAIGVAPSTINYTEVGDLISTGAGLVQSCQSAVQATIPGLPAEAQSAASAYVAALGAVLPILKLSPTDSATLDVWAAQFSTVLGPLSAAKGALATADPDFAD
ncbi:MAG: hypothetical protein EBX39_10350 [Actinobacteria bacterium]|nr:hypothetical protein [Actinomycetota bacterium]